MLYVTLEQGDAEFDGMHLNIDNVRCLYSVKMLEQNEKEAGDGPLKMTLTLVEPISNTITFATLSALTV